jgi:hypothetical protein
MIVLLIAGIGVILAGLAAIGFGVPVKEFGFGNTLILTGAVGVCTGLIMISLGLVVREMRRLAEALAVPEPRVAAPLPRRELKLPSAPLGIDDESEEMPAPAPFARETPPRPMPTGPEPGVPPWQDEVLRDRERLAAAAGSTAEEPKRRNLLFTSTRRDREKDRTDAVAQALELDLAGPAPVPPREEASRFDEAPQADEAPRFADAWPQNERPSPQSERPRFSDAIRQAARASATHAERFGDRLPDPSEIPDRDEPAPTAPARAPGVTVLKSGVVDGMAYSLYSDGSIEAQMPEGLMRFASIDELREHLENRS